MPQILKVDPLIPTLWEDIFAKTKEVLKAGGIIAFPTDTFYGLGADPFNKTAVDKIYEIKGRDSKKPLLLLIDSPRKLDALIEEPSRDSSKLIETFWPGPLTILFKPKPTIPKNITTGLIGIRQPGNSITRKLLSSLDHPLTAPSANLNGENPATTAEEVNSALKTASEGAMKGIIKYGDLIDDIDFVKGNDDSHGFTLKNYIEYLAKEIY